MLKSECSRRGRDGTAQNCVALPMSCTHPVEARRTLQDTVRQRLMKAWGFTICDDMQHGHRDRRMKLARCRADICQREYDVSSICTRLVYWPCRSGSQLLRLEAAARLEVIAIILTPQPSRVNACLESYQLHWSVELAEQPGCKVSRTNRHCLHNLHALKCPLQCSLRFERDLIHIQIVSEEK